MTTDTDLHTLTGAYALHALSDEEGALFEQHLNACPSCAEEITEFTATAAKLAAAVAVTPSPAMKGQVQQRVTTVRQVAPHVPRTPPAARLRRRLPPLLLAACLAAATALGGVAVWEHNRAEDAVAQQQQARRQADELATVLGASDAVSRRIPLRGASATLVVSRAQDKAVVVAADMVAPPKGKVYQLWYDQDGTMRPAGLMDTDRTRQTVALSGSANSASAVGITVEPAGGSDRPTSAPLAVVNLPT
ncbi:anti-sigma factor [Streptomyces sp. WAC04114]|uniref:anti-sigma factor n=1 Tax=Streptomyces sp. WAC04114 TaxID=2867961 RepID=UPI001C8C15C6|nr:anti-sigma factor [Streptomyces sp. WAC04114]MBX9362252.1 anti-sigma factor [Streptomyces sp. WAC04114]